MQNDKALKCFRKTKNYAVLAEIKEKTGKYNDAIRILLKHGDHRNIIKALDCASKHEGNISACYQKERLAHKYAHAMLSETIDLHDPASIEHFKSILKYLPASHQVDYLKRVKLYNEACEILLSEIKYADVYQLCKGQGWFDKGLDIAEKNKDANEKMMFLLFKATRELESNGFSESTKTLLRKMFGLHTEKEVLCMLVYGMGIRNSTLISRACLYYHQRNKPIAYLEALHIATAEVRYDSDEHTWHNIHLNKHEKLEITILNACRSIKDIKEKLEHVQDTSSPYIAHMETFFGLQKDHSGIYLVPETSYPWTNRLLQNIISVHLLERNSDNFFKVEASVVLKTICGHLGELCDNWIAKDNIKVVQAYCKRLNRFPYHQVITHDSHLKESYLAKLDKTTHLQAYLDILSSLYEMKEFGSQNIPFDILRTVVNVLAPQATCYLQTPTLDMQPSLLKHHQYVSQLMLSQQLNRALYNIAKATLSTNDEKFNLNEWLELWRIQSVTKLGFNEMQKTLTKKTIEIIHLIRSMQNQALSIPQCYIHLPKHRTYNHLMISWLNVCDQFKSKRVFSACTICVHDIIRPIASNQLLWETLSVSNLLNIVTVQLVFILTMLGICTIHSRKPGNVYVPLSYFNSVKVFLSMAGGPNFFDSSLEDMQRRRKEALPQLQNKLTNLMRMILNFFIGKHNFAFNPLKMATSDEYCLQNHEAEQCVIFVLTLLGNLGVNQSVTDKELHSFRHQICDSIKHCTVPTIKQAYERFSTCATLSGCFGAIRIILEPTKDILQHMDIHFEAASKVTYKAKPALLMTILQRRLIPLSEITTKESKAVEIKESKLRPTAPTFVPSWMKSAVSSTENEPQQASIDTDDTELDDVDIPLLHNQESIPDETADDTNDNEYFMISGGICIICGCSVKSDINDDAQEKDDSTYTVRSLFLEHSRSVGHQTKKTEYQNFSAEMEDCTLHKLHLSELAKNCQEQYEASRQDHELKKIMDAITKVIKEFETEQQRIRESAEWREGMTYMRDIEGEMRSLIMRGEREIEFSKERKLKLDREEEEEDQKEDEEEDDFDEDDWDERIPDTELNYGESAKKKKRKVKRIMKVKG